MLLNTSIVFSAVPEIINYQGSLSDSTGNPVNATVNITFTLYDVESGPGTILWQETQSVDVTNGLFNVQLGADTVGNPLSASILNDPVYLGVQIDTDAEMTPRQRVTSAAFAIKAQSVENDTLNSLSCGSGEIPKWNGTAWACAADTDTDTDTNAAMICPDGTFLNGDGTCDPVVVDTNTTYSAGSGLVLNGTTFSIAANGVTSNEIADDAVTAAKIAGGAGSGVDADLLDGLEASAIQANAVAQANANRSVLYTRWGRSDCPAGATLVYAGITGGGLYTQSGSGGNQLCLALDPTFAQFDNGNQNGALLYATQYWSVGSVPVISALHMHYVPCAVCEKSNAAVMFMQPGKDSCPTGFNTEYPGYLMAKHYTHSTSEYVCVDQAPTSFNGSAGGGSLGNLLYTTEVECPGGVNDPLCVNNYVSQREVTCSVCTK